MAYTDAKELVRAFVERLGVTIESIDDLEVAAHKMYNIKTPDSKMLIGPQGDHLRALNHLLRRMSEREEATKEQNFIVDVNGYQHARIRDIEQKARLLADRVRTFKSSAEMSPMNAYERMIIHAMFANDLEVTTTSDGIGPTRHIVLQFRDAPTQ